MCEECLESDISAVFLEKYSLEYVILSPHYTGQLPGQGAGFPPPMGVYFLPLL